MSASDPRGELERLGRATDARLRRRAAWTAARAACARAAPWTLAGPLLVLLVHLAQRASTGAPWTLGLVPTLLLALAPLLAWVLASVWRALAQPADVGLGLATLDRELDTHERLWTAWELAGLSETTPFSQAAIEDGARQLERARVHRLAPARHSTLPARAWLLPACALLVAWLAVHWTPSGSASGAGEHSLTPPALVAESAPARSGETATRPSTPETQVAERERRAHEQPAERRAQEQHAQAEMQQTPRESSGKSGEGRSADAAPSSQPSDSQGVPSAPTQPSSHSDPAKLGQQPRKPKPAKDARPAPKKKPTEESGATAGRGVGSGSSRNPGATDWASKDQVSSDEEAQLTEDEDVEDESDESEARGGLQPSLRDRRPAANRDLTIAFGNQPNPDANGRGGPSEQKKSRGVASLVLGVPIPDHVKGRPNPGRTKITQERVEPRAEEAARLAASGRSPRAAPIGALARPELVPWMRALVRAYFLSPPSIDPNPAKKP